jgi:hypothetical protein
MLDIAVNHGFVYPIQSGIGHRRELKKAGQLAFVELDRQGLVSALCMHTFLELLREVQKGGHRLPLPDADFPLGERRSVRRFHLPCYSRIALLAGLLNVLAIEPKVVPVDLATLEDCPSRSPPLFELSAGRSDFALRHTAC